MNTPTPPTPHEQNQYAHTSGLAIASLVFGFLILVPFGFIVAIILGIVALIKINGSNGDLKGKGLAITGIALGVAYIPIFGLLVAMAIPAFEKVRKSTRDKVMINQAHWIATEAQQKLIEQKLRKIEVATVIESSVSELPSYIKIGSDSVMEIEGEFSLIEDLGTEYFFDSNGNLTRKIDSSAPTE